LTSDNRRLRTSVAKPQATPATKLPIINSKAYTEGMIAIHVKI